MAEPSTSKGKRKRKMDAKSDQTQAKKDKTVIDMERKHSELEKKNRESLERYRQAQAKRIEEESAIRDEKKKMEYTDVVVKVDRKPNDTISSTERVYYRSEHRATPAELAGEGYEQSLPRDSNKFR